MTPVEFDPGPLAEVACRTEGERATLVFVRDFAQPPEAVWAVLTEAGQVVRWAPFEPDHDLATTGPAVLRMTDGQTVEEHQAEVLRAEAPAVLEYTWGEDTLTWELAPQGDGTRLTLSHNVQSVDWVPRVAAGWHLCLVVAESLLSGHPIGRIVGREAREYGWDSLNAAYAAELRIPVPVWPEENETGPED